MNRSPIIRDPTPEVLLWTSYPGSPPTLDRPTTESGPYYLSINRMKVGHKRPRSTEKQTRNRTHYNFKQIAVLEEIFEKHLFCPQAERKKVAQILGLTELNVSFFHPFDHIIWTIYKIHIMKCGIWPISWAHMIWVIWKVNSLLINSFRSNIGSKTAERNSGVQMVGKREVKWMTKRLLRNTFFQF